MQEPAEIYKAAILSIIQTIRSEHPDCEFLLVSPMIPNPEIRSFQHNQLPAQQDALYQIAAEYVLLRRTPCSASLLPIKSIIWN
jgi:hypothetical protein